MQEVLCCAPGVVCVCESHVSMRSGMRQQRELLHQSEEEENLYIALKCVEGTSPMIVTRGNLSLNVLRAVSSG